MTYLDVLFEWLKQILKFWKWLCYMRTNTICGQKNLYKRFSSSFSHCNRSRKTDQVNWTPENVALRRNSTKMAAPLFLRIKRNIFGFEVIKHQYIDIHYTKNQAENMFTACSFLLLKTHFSFHIALYFRTMSWNQIVSIRKWAGQLYFYAYIAKKQIFYETKCDACKYKTFLDFHNVLNAPRIVPFVPINVWLFVHLPWP